MKNKRRIIGIVAAMLLALIGTVSLVGYVRSAKDKAVADEALVEVYVVDDFVPKGAAPETIKSAVSLEQVPARLKQTGAITTLDEVGDNVAATDLQPGDQLLVARLTAVDVVSEKITDKVQVSANLESERAVGGALQKGDLVGVYLSFDPFDLDDAGQTAKAVEELNLDDADDTGQDGAVGIATDPDSGVDDPIDQDGNDEADGAAADGEAAADGPEKTPNVTKLEFQHVLVTNVQTINPPVTSDDDSDDDGGIAQVTGTQYVVTLALSAEQSERFVFATEFGHIWLAIEPATVADDGSRLVTLGNVYTVVAK
jgi:pilus assembly protein CpaB